MSLHPANVFAKRLKIARKQKKISQVQLGILSGIDPNSASARMNQYERGKHSPDFLTLTKIAETLNVPVAYFYADDDDLATLIMNYHRISSEKRQTIHDFITSLTTNS